MSEKTVTVGDTDVEIRETEDGFEAKPIEDAHDEPETVAIFEDGAGLEKHIDASALGEIEMNFVDERSRGVLLYDEAHMAGRGSTTVVHNNKDFTDSKWDGSFHFDDMRIEDA